MEDSMEVLKGLHISFIDDEENEQIDENVYDDIDDDEDDEVCIPVTLGFAEKPDKSWALLHQLFPSKAGGNPAWLDPVNLPLGRSTMCDLCEEPLQFLLQVYAPISEKEPSFHRLLYVFTCMSQTCLLRDQHEQWRHEPHKPSRSVKVFRCQLPRTNQFYSSNPPKHDGTDRPLFRSVHGVVHGREAKYVAVVDGLTTALRNTRLYTGAQVINSNADKSLLLLNHLLFPSLQKRFKKILPQLLYYLRVQNETNSLDWATIAIYTCGESCAYKEEFAWLQLSSQST